MKTMKLYQKLKERDLVSDEKDYSELVWMRAIQINGSYIDNPEHELLDAEVDIKVGILSLN
jgi:hypothetical protein